MLKSYTKLFMLKQVAKKLFVVNNHGNTPCLEQGKHSIKW